MGVLHAVIRSSGLERKFLFDPHGVEVFHPSRGCPFDWIVTHVS
jgi:hypothetical protein